MRREFIISVGAGFILSALWRNMWVKPNAQMLYNISDCMGADRSEASYDRCVAEFRNTHSNND